MVDDVQGPLETTGGVGEEVGVIGDADSSDTVGPKIKAKFRALQRQETRVYVNLKMSTCSDMTLSLCARRSFC